MKIPHDHSPQRHSFQPSVPSSIQPYAQPSENNSGKRSAGYVANRSSKHAAKHTFLCLVLVTLLVASHLLPAWAAGYPRNATLEFRDTAITLDNYALRLEQPLVWLEGQPYGPAMPLGAFLGVGIRFDAAEGWLELATEGVLNQPGTNPWAGEVARLGYEKTQLQQHQQALEASLAALTTSGTGSSTGTVLTEMASLREAERFLRDVFGRVQGIPLSVTLADSGSQLMTLTITVSETDRRDFERLARSTVTAYVEDLVAAATTLAPGLWDVTGTLRSQNGTTRTLVEFELSRGDTRPALTFRYTPSSSSSSRDTRSGTVTTTMARRVEDRLNDRLNRYDGVDYSFRAQAARDELDLIIDTRRSDYEALSQNRRESFLTQVAEEINQAERNLYVWGEVLDEDTGRFLESFRMDSGRLRWHSATRYDDRYDDYYDDRYRYDDRYWEDDRYWDSRDDRWRNWQQEAGTTTETAAPAREQDAYAALAAPVAITTQQTGITLYPLRMTVDGVSFHSQEEMFVWQNTLYVPLGEWADALYLTLTNDPVANTLRLGSNPAARSQMFPSMLQQLEADKQAIATLRTTVASLEEQLNERQQAQQDESRRVPYRRITTLAAMERYLEDYYETIDGISTYINLSRISGSRYRLRITYDAADFNRFDALSRQRIENWVGDMEAALQELFDADATVEGWITSRNTASNEYTYITFTSRDGSLRFNFEEHGGSSGVQTVDITELLRILRRYLGRFDGISYEYDAQLIRRDVELTVITPESRFMNRSVVYKRDYLKALQTELEDKYPNIRVDGFMVNSRSEEPFYRFAIERGELRSYSLMEDVARELNRNWNRYDDLRFTYLVREDTDGSVRVKLEGDFAIQESAWRSVDETDFDNWAEDVAAEAVRLLNRNVTLEVVDRVAQVILVKGRE
ncbi:hypothetical protein [Anoxynatronum buryatiense]|uniref:Uncharacterized protein n=1 Tax=Anoxynatronum buryatiense TaxID=489973 RepID=A0AA45WW17_9CLOT|nr:hypothetical protein [Anoxynatronum buryatiense]SMP56588.1 hypothetical protein SAMN06296020_10684 [Anoxynatronum buryatiense]